MDMSELPFKSHNLDNTSSSVINMYGSSLFSGTVSSELFQGGSGYPLYCTLQRANKV